MIKEPNLSLRKESAISVIDMETFLKGVASRLPIPDIEKRFYDSLNKGQPFSTMSWVSHIADIQAQRHCLSRAKNLKPVYEWSKAQNERFSEIIAGYGNEGAERDLIEWQQTCAHFDLFALSQFLNMAYGVPFDSLIDFEQGTMPTFDKDPLYQVIKSFKNRATRNVLFQELPRSKKVVTILKLENTGLLEARDVKVRLNFILPRIRTGSGLGITMIGGPYQWQVVREPIDLEGGTVSERFPNSAEVFYWVVPAKGKKFIYVITHQNDIPDGMFHLEPIPYLSRIPHVSIRWFISICVISIIFATRKTILSKK